jgi:hypothetical protein
MSAGRSVLLITGGDAVMRRTFREQGRAYWSAEFALILEKHGWLDFATGAPELLADAAGLDGYQAVIVAWLPEDVWRPEYVETLRGYDGIVLLEGPFPPAVEELLEVERSGEAIVGASGPLSFGDGARAYLEARFGTTFPIGHRSGPEPSTRLGPSGSPQPLRLGPRRTITRKSGVSRNAYFELDPEPFEQNAGRGAISLVLAYRARFMRGQTFFDDPVDDALALLACVRCLAAVPAGPLRNALRDLVRDAAGSNRPPVRLADARSALARTVWGVALVEAAAALEDLSFARRAREVVGDFRDGWYSRAPADGALARWRALLVLALTELPAENQPPAGALAIGAFVPAPDGPPTPLLAWLDEQLSDRLGPDAIGSAPTSATWVGAVSAALRGSTGGDLPRGLDGFTLPDLMVLLGCLRRRGELPAARRLWRRLLDTAIVPTMAGSVSPLIALGLLEASAPIELAQGPAQAISGYSTEQIQAWAAPPYTLQPYAGVEEAVAILEDDAGPVPAIWRRGNLIATSFQLLAHLVHIHTVEPVIEPFAQFRSGDAIALEYLLVALLGSALAERPPAVVTVAPWPWGISYGLTIRHDVDRILGSGEFTRLFEFERSHSLAVSWFWLPDRLEPGQLATLEREPGHEVALHSVWLDQKERELTILARAVSRPMAGEALHGAGDSWLGHLSVRAAVDAGLFYTELAPPIADSPYARYPWIDAEGVVDAERIVGVTYNISIDGMLGTKPGSEGGPRLYRQLLNHPDINFDRLRNWVQSLPAEPRVDWTCDQVARWWRATHAEGGLSIRHVAGEDPDTTQFELTSPVALTDVELRIPGPPGSLESVWLDGSEAEWAELAEPEHPGVRVRVSLEPDRARTVALRHAGAAPVTSERQPAAATDGAN